MKFACVQTKLFLCFFINLSFSTLPRLPLVSHLFTPVTNNPCSFQPTSAPFLPAPLSVLGVCGVGCIPIASVITPISSPLSVLSDCPPNMSFSDPVSIYSTTRNVILLTLPPIYIIYPLSADINLPVVVSGLLD